MPQTKLLTTAQSKPFAKQHTSPCSDCPWRRNSIKGWLGPWDPQTWVNIAQSEERIECHTSKDRESGDQWNCAGAAIFRANIFKDLRDPLAFRLKRNVTAVFAWGKEFIEHHLSSNNRSWK